jgi:hypothetical protein
MHNKRLTFPTIHHAGGLNSDLTASRHLLSPSPSPRTRHRRTHKKIESPAKTQSPTWMATLSGV